ncbi:NmrA/HSCARG family protein [Inquilinus limosus]|uniref:NmrA/HSCARG family protein n=1 Tax=Inquilinus limosus TaxID=171674 RepID=UPI003F15E605
MRLRDSVSRLSPITGQCGSPQLCFVANQGKQTMTTKRNVLVTGATGQQGGAVASALLSRGHRVRAVTRKPDGDAARRLASAGVEIVAGDLGDAASIRQAAGGVDTMFLMTDAYEAGPAEETRQGILAADVAKAAGIGHLIYSSVASADRKTGIPHFESKYLVEKHIAGLGIPHTISAPVAFMENAVAPWAIDGLRQGVHAFALPPGREIQLVAVADIGAFVAALAERRDQVFGKRFDIAGDELTGEAQAKVLSQAIGRPIAYREIPVAVMRQQSEDTALMFEWFDRVGYSADIAALRRDFPEIRWHSFADWARAFDWSLLDRTSSV